MKKQQSVKREKNNVASSSLLVACLLCVAPPASAVGKKKREGEEGRGGKNKIGNHALLFFFAGRKTDELVGLWTEGGGSPRGGSMQQSRPAGGSNATESWLPSRGVGYMDERTERLKILMGEFAAASDMKRRMPLGFWLLVGVLHTVSSFSFVESVRCLWRARGVAVVH